MADTAAPTAAMADLSVSPRAGRGRGARSNRGTSNGPTSPTFSDSRGRGPARGPRGQRAGRRGRGHNHDFSATPAEGSSGRPPGGGFGARLTEAASTQTQGEGHGPQSQSQPQSTPIPAQEGEGTPAEEAEVCFICASPIEHVAIAPCNHQTCHICSLRLRALYKSRACAHCRTEAPFVIFTDNADKRFEDFNDRDVVKVDENLGIKYEKDIILEDTILLLRYNCPDKDCDVACLGWPDLHRHVKSKHGRVMCDLCTRNKKVFTHEHELFSFGELRKHEKFGDDNPGAVDQSGFKGHPECGFCRQRFYGDDELYTHCREKHERCHICDRRDGGRNPQYYLNYQELEKHFADAHFVCLDAECQANKTNVFESEMDLKAHQLSAHPNGLSKDARREARLVDLSGFEVRTPYQPQRRGGRENRDTRGAGRGRDPNSEPLPLSTAQPLSRAELAYQRQLAIQSSQSVSNRTFGGQLTQPAQTPTHRPAPPAQASRPTPPSQAADPSQPVAAASLTPQEQARALRHAAVTERASTLLKNDPTKLSQFRNHVSSYRSGSSSASDLIDSFFSLFDCPSSELGKLIRELSDLYEDDQKRQALLTAWNNWRSINEDYPSLPGPSGTLPGVSSTSGSGRRVLTLKRSTAQSSRSAVSRQGSWGNTITSGTPRDPFPALAATNRPGPSANTTPAVWSASTTPQPTPVASTQRPSTAAASRATPPARNEDLFPALPKAQKPNTLMPGFNTRGAARWSPSGSGTQTPVNAWSNGGGNPTPAQASAAVAAAAGGGDNIGGETSKKGKGRKGKKEVLFQFG